MNNGLREAIDNEMRSAGLNGPVRALALDPATAAVRAFLALPPSEEEIAAAATAVCNARPPCGRPVPCTSCTQYAKAALVASRAVLVRPPEATS